MTKELSEVVVEGRNASLGAEMSVFRPTSRQKNAAQSAADLLSRMAIPQLQVSPTEEITDLAGKSVDVFIDFLPASKDDLRGMRMQDVKRVEYYLYPSDPRFQGKQRVINFIMQKYEYGGYVKLMGTESTNNTGQLNVYGKTQYKLMTFDVAVGALYNNNDHIGNNLFETFRLPQSDGNTKTFERNAIITDGRLRERVYWPTFKALYSNGKVTVQNVLGASFNHMPSSNTSGNISYVPEAAATSEYFTNSSDRVNSISYSGFLNIVFNDKNTLSFNPRYSYSHTNTASLYSEVGAGDYYNGAKDDSHQLSANLSFGHSFGNNGHLNVIMDAQFLKHSIKYSGTSRLLDHSRSLRLSPGIQYSISRNVFFGLVAFGLNWDRQKYLQIKKSKAAPWARLSLEYSPTQKHALRGQFSYSQTMPTSGDRSEAVIQANPLMSYTGNPYLTPFDSYNAYISYTFIPSPRFYLSAYGSIWVVGNRYVYDYEPTQSGILRTIKQPVGGYGQYNFGVSATGFLLGKSLQVTGRLNTVSSHNGSPYDFNKTGIYGTIQAYYYLGHWSFAGMYLSPVSSPDGCMVGTWVKNKSSYYLQAGWANGSWNLRLQIFNFARWNWKTGEKEMSSQYYDFHEDLYGTSNHASARLTATYTFGFGKKIREGNEASQLQGADSGILNRR